MNLIETITLVNQIYEEIQKSEKFTEVRKACLSLQECIEHLETLVKTIKQEIDKTKIIPRNLIE